MHDDYVATLADWVAMLSISTRWIFEKVRERAIKEITARLGKVEAFELIRLAIKYDVEQWFKPAYRRIVTRAELITHAESVKIPYRVTIMLTRSREQYWKHHQPGIQQPGQLGGAILTPQQPSVINPQPGVRSQNAKDPDAIIEAEIRLMAAESAGTPDE